ncbi:MAG: malto-oligosyltrehalose synthase, partial [Nitrospinota bacterium]
MRIPVATYRLQFSPALGWRQAQEIVPYLAALGISDIYASPIFQARPGSTHGYDVVDPTRLNPELGTAEDFDILIQQVKARNMGWLQDIVPNHMAYDGTNPLLRDVLENGESSPHFSVFDIDWSHPYASLRGRVLAPFLGRPYGEALEAGDITLRYDRQGFTINYYTLQLPLKIESYIPLLTHRLSLLRRRLGEDHPDYIKFLGILYSLKNLPLAPTDYQERADQIRFIKRMLWELYTQNATLRDFLQENISLFQGEAGKPESITRLDHLLSEQHFRLAFWKVATEEINYRRFFNINELISLHMEE